MNCVGLSIPLRLFSRLSGTTPDGRAVAEVGEGRWGRGGGLPVEAGVVRQLRQVMRVAHQSLTQFCCNAGPAS